MLELINDFNQEELKGRVADATPYPYFYLDNFLDEAFANEIHDAFPSFANAQKLGRTFKAVNESGKVQICNANKFPEPILKLHQLLASEEFLETMSNVMGIPKLIADPTMKGGGIHETGPGGHLDVHVDFNIQRGSGLHRRLNILLFFNKDWKKEYGGEFEIWDKDVAQRHQALLPVFNRCACFATSKISYHGVNAVNCPPNMSRKSFAAYYYTKEAPEGWNGEHHTTIFKARPNELVKGKVLMPMKSTKDNILNSARKLFKGK